eukprot:m.513659 g.513659  ORF g.513659 m.513659 type:complete len:463 (-) comp21906_c1_seq13:2452-3840(-)
MGYWPKKYLGDADDLLAYSTPKMVKVRDWRLGGLNYAFQLAIAIYIIIWAVIINAGYNELEPVSAGSVNIQLRRAGLTDFVDTENTYPYCCALDGDTATWNSTTLCNGTTAYSRTGLPCLWWNDLAADYQVGLDSSIAVTSRVDISTEPRCDLDEWHRDTTCLTEASESGYYVAGVEKFTLLIQHGVAGLIVDKSGKNTGDTERMEGVMLDTADEEVFLKAEQGMDFKNRIGDIIEIEEILNASGVALDAERPDAVSGDTSTVRYDGTNIVLYVEYYIDRDSGDLKYRYKPRHLSDLEYKVKQVANVNDTHVEIYNRHAIRILVVQTGIIGKFSFQALLTTLVTSVALLAVSTTIVNLLMTKLFYMKELYKFHKYEVSEDFSEWRSTDKDKFQQMMDTVAAVNRGDPTVKRSDVDRLTDRVGQSYEHRHDDDVPPQHHHLGTDLQGSSTTDDDHGISEITAI